jgi:hypothetical protein
LVMPHLVGFVLERTGSFVGPTLLVATLLVVAAALVLSIKVMFFGRPAPVPAS